MIELLAAAVLASAPYPDDACRAQGEPLAWLGEAFAARRLVRDELALEAGVPPAIILFDRACRHAFDPDPTGSVDLDGDRYRVASTAHAGEIALPDGTSIPASRQAFASPASESAPAYFVMALPDLWRAGPSDGRNPDLLTISVFLHEFAHVSQFVLMKTELEALLSLGLPEAPGDDVIQALYEQDEAYARLYAAERDAAYALAEEPDPARAGRSLTALRDMVSARRGSQLGGSASVHGRADDLFLTLEGSANWLAWTWLVHPVGGALSREDATRFMRGRARRWSQDEGLGLMLALDRVCPGLPAAAFRPPWRGVGVMLEVATSTPVSPGSRRCGDDLAPDAAGL